MKQVLFFDHSPVFFVFFFISGTHSNHENRSFTRLSFTIAYRYILPPYSFQIRVGGLYMIYALYNTQLVWPKEKVIHVSILSLFLMKLDDSALPVKKIWNMRNIQLIVCFTQIRIALKDWNDVQKLITEAKSCQHLDVVYILKRLLSAKAFYFTAMPKKVSMFYLCYCVLGCIFLQCLKKLSECD